MNTQGKSGAGKPGGGLARARGGRGKFVASMETAKRDATAAQMRSDGHTFAQIAEALGYATEAAAYQGVQRAMLAIVREPAEEALRMELRRLDELYLMALTVARKTHYAVSAGRVVHLFDEEGNKTPVKDYQPVLAAIDRMIKIGERRAKLLGLDQPTKVEFWSFETIDNEYRRLCDELGVAPEPLALQA